VLVEAVVHLVMILYLVLLHPRKVVLAGQRTRQRLLLQADLVVAVLEEARPLVVRVIHLRFLRVRAILEETVLIHRGTRLVAVVAVLVLQVRLLPEIILLAVEVLDRPLH
jgi:hypothetical protein